MRPERWGVSDLLAQLSSIEEYVARITDDGGRSKHRHPHLRRLRQEGQTGRTQRRHCRQGGNELNQINYLLACLAEEGVEVAQRCTKALRFGLGEIQPAQDLTNAERIAGEVNDMRAVLRMLEAHGVIDATPDEEAIQAKIAKVEKFMDYSIAEGQLDGYTPYAALTAGKDQA